MYDFQFVDDNGTITYVCAKCRSEAIEAYCREKGCSKEYVKEHCVITHWMPLPEPPKGS